MASFPAKDPEEVLDYQIDWTKTLESGETISLSTWAVAEGTVVIDSDSHTDAVTTIWLSGGTLDETNLLTNHITTTAGREREQSVKLKIKAK